MALPKVGVELVAAQAAQFVSDINNANKATDKLGDTLGKTADKGSSKLAGLQKAAGVVGTALGGAAVAGVAALAGAAVGLGATLLDVSDRARTMRQSMGELGTEELQGLDAATRLLESRFGADLPGQLDATRSAMANFGLTTDEAMDVLTAGFEESLNVSDDFLDTITEYSVNFAQLGFTADESLGLLNRGLEAGARNSDVVADAVKEFGILINEAGTATGLQEIDGQLAGLVTSFQQGEISGTEAFDAIIARLAAIEDPVAQQAAGVELFGTKFEDLGIKAITALGGVQEGVINSAGATEEAGARIESLGEVFGRVGGIIANALVPVNDALLKFANDNMPAFQAAAETAMNAVSSAFGAIAGPVQSAMSAIQSALQGGIAPTGAWASSFATAQGVITSVMGALQGVIGSVLGVIQAFWQKNGSSILSFVGQTWNQIAQIITSVMQVIQAIVVPIWNTVASFISSNQDTIVAILTGAWNNIQTIITTALSVIQGVVNTVLAALQGDWSGAWSEIQNLSATFVQGILDVITNTLNTILGVFGSSLGTLKEDVSSAFSEIVSTISGFVSDAASAAADIADALIDGMTGGIQRGARRVADAARNAAQSAFDAAKDFLGIESPSKAFAELGENTAQGFAQGILDNIDVALDAATELGSIVLEEARTFSDQIVEAVNAAFEDVLQNTADFARGRGGASRGLAGLLPDDRGLQRAQEDLSDAELDLAEAEERLRAIQRGEIKLGETTQADEIAEVARQRELLLQAQAAVESEQAAFDAQSASAQNAADAIAQLRAETEALAESDPEGAARLFDLRSEAILEAARLEQEIAEETSERKRALLEDELALIQFAQAQELSILQQELSTRQSTMLADLEAAQAAATQLGNLIYYTQEDVGRTPDPGILQLAQSLIGQLGQFGGSITNYNYSPTYAGGAPAATQDFNTLRTLAG